MVGTKFKDNYVRLFLDDVIVKEQTAITGATIGTYWELEDDLVEKKDSDSAFVGTGASLTDSTVNEDGEVYVDDGGRLVLISVDGGTLTGAPICENSSRWYGGAICLTATDLTEYGKGAVHLTGGTFSGNSAFELNGYAGVGGAIDTYGGVFSVDNGLFVNNSVVGFTGAGGALGLLYSTNTVTGGTFSGNSAYYGGAIHQNGGTLTVYDAYFTGNTSTGDTTKEHTPGGGALELHAGAEALVSGSTFTANSATFGGAVLNDTFNGSVSQISLADCVFDANTAVEKGGAIYNYADMTVTNGIFTGNNVIDDPATSWVSFGGAVANTKGGTLAVTGGEFTGNSAVQGGAIATFIAYGSSETADLAVTDAVFGGNSAAYGGAIYIQTGAEDATTITGGTFSGNSASYGGGAICDCFGPLTVTGGTFSANSSLNDGGAIAVWDSSGSDLAVTDAVFDGNSAPYGGAISHTWASAPLTISGCTFTANGGETALQGGAVWNDENSTGLVTVSGCTFDGNTAEAGGALYNGGNMKLENIVLATASDTVYNGGSLAISGVNTIGASVVNDGRITFSLGLGPDALVDDLGAFSGSGTYLLKCTNVIGMTGGSSIATFATTAGTFTGTLSIKHDNKDLADVFTLKDGVIGNDLAVIGNNFLLRLDESDSGVLTVVHQLMKQYVPMVSNDASVIAWAGAADTGSWVEIAQGNTFDNAIRIATDGTAFDVASAAGAYTAQVAEAGGEFTADSASWTTAAGDPRQVVSNANGRADVFFASPVEGDVWTAQYIAKNTVTGETAAITGKNRIRDTFSGSESDANILYLTDDANGDALFMDDIYSEFGEAARVNLIREVRAGAGDDVVDMTGEHYSAELAGMTARGGAGDDVIWGANGGNSLFGDDGNDIVSGGTGDDLIAGGSGNDTLNGGGGSDIFAFGENWGTDIVTQLPGGTVALWFIESSDQITAAEIDGNSVFTNSDGTASVTVKGIALENIAVRYGDNGSDSFKALASAGAFLGSTTDSVFETAQMRSQGILASL